MLNIRPFMNIKGEREVWFKRTLLWSSVPVHWKGTVTILVMLLVALPANLAGISLLNHHHDILGMTYVVIFIVTIVAGIGVAELHMSN